MIQDFRLSFHQLPFMSQIFIFVLENEKEFRHSLHCSWFRFERTTTLLYSLFIQISIQANKNVAGINQKDQFSTRKRQWSAWSSWRISFNALYCNPTCNLAQDLASTNYPNLASTQDPARTPGQFPSWF